MKNLLILLVVAIIGTTLISAKKEKTKYVLIETKYGNMKVKLYNETPLHRDNFLKLVDEGFYDSLIFHRVIKDFMIQGGDPDSKNAPRNKKLGTGGPGYQVDAEIIPGLYHKKGALCAARKGGPGNPEKKSSGSQFYIVQGAKVEKDKMKMMMDQANFPIKKKLVLEYVDKPENASVKARVDSLRKAGDYKTINTEMEKISKIIEPEYLKSEDLYTYSEEQLDTYATIGGTPHLDNKYTVFGEVVEGLNIIDSIALVQTQSGDRPYDDIIMKMKKVKK